MDAIRLFLDQLLQFHSIEQAYLKRHGDLLSYTWRQIHDESCDRWDILTKGLRIYDGTYMLPPLDLPPDYNERDSLDQLRGFYWVARAAADVMRSDPNVGALAKRVYDRYDAAEWFLSGWIKFHLSHE